MNVDVLLSSSSFGARVHEAQSSDIPWLGALAALVGAIAYVGCFVLAAKTGKLKTLDYLAGTLGFGCGIGWMYFLSRANSVTLQHGFDLIHAGGEPSVSRALNRQFKIAAGTTVVCWVLSAVLLR